MPRFALTSLIPHTLSSETLSLLERIFSSVLGESYELSVVLCGNEKSHELNKAYRDKDYPTNILSFPISENAGEIFIDLEKAQEEANAFEREFENFVLFLFIHGLLHLKGYNHGSTMEAAEMRVRKEFGV
jgi:probable rRNA maturation factor